VQNVPTIMESGTSIEVAQALMPTCKRAARMIPRLLLHLAISGHVAKDATTPALVSPSTSTSPSTSKGSRAPDDGSPDGVPPASSIAELSATSSGYRIGSIASGARITRVLATLAPQTQHLHLERLPLLSDMGVRGILRLVGAQLSSLSLNRCKSLTSEAIVAVGRLAPRLRRLSLRNCYLLDSKALQALLAGLDPERIAYVDFSACLLLQDEDVRAMLKRWQKLRVLHLSRDRNVTDWGLRCLDASTHRQLEYLGITGISLLTKACVLRLANLPALRWIELPPHLANDEDVRRAMGDRVTIVSPDPALSAAPSEPKDRAAMTSSLGVPSLTASSATLGNPSGPSPVPPMVPGIGMPQPMAVPAVVPGGQGQNLSTSLNASSFVPPPVHPGALMAPVPVPGVPGGLPLGQQQLQPPPPQQQQVVVPPPMATPAVPPPTAAAP